MNFYMELDFYSTSLLSSNDVSYVLLIALHEKYIIMLFRNYVYIYIFSCIKEFMAHFDIRNLCSYFLTDNFKSFPEVLEIFQLQSNHRRFSLANVT